MLLASGNRLEMITSPSPQQHLKYEHFSVTTPVCQGRCAVLCIVDVVWKMIIAPSGSQEINVTFVKL